MMHSPDTAEVTGAMISGGSIAASTALPHPLQIAAWIIAIVAGVFTIYRGFRAEQRAARHEARMIEKMDREAYEEE